MLMIFCRDDAMRAKNNAHRGRRIRWASFWETDAREEDERQSHRSGYWEEEDAAPNS